MFINLPVEYSVISVRKIYLKELKYCWKMRKGSIWIFVCLVSAIYRDVKGSIMLSINLIFLCWKLIGLLRKSYFCFKDLKRMFLMS